MSFAELWESLLPIGRTETGYRRYTWTEADVQCRAWFAAQAAATGLDVETDQNGNLWGWWDTASGSRRHAVVTGSHLDSVPDGGAFDGPLGVVSALAAVRQLRERGSEPAHPIAVAVFMEEEGGRFGSACLGSKLLTGAIDPDVARVLTDDQGVTFAQAMTGAGLDPDRIGRDDQRLGQMDAFVELHVEQGRALGPLGAPIGLAESIWPHGRWRFDFGGRPDHAGTARFDDRNDPVIAFAQTTLAARVQAGLRGALATFGKVNVVPGAVNGVAAAVHAWLDARAADEKVLSETVTGIRYDAQGCCDEHGVSLDVRQESATPLVAFDLGLRERLARVLGNVPVLATGAGHDAGVFAARLPAAMLFVRNPTGVSHSPAERADRADCEAGVQALAAVLEDLAC
jgi:beta-ureidopropionase / N-carbamoyl-L-amino-acid hydrolase